MTEQTFRDALHEALDVIDRHLAEEAMPLTLRPVHATLEFVRHCILGVRQGDGPSAPPGTATDVMLSDWFKPLVADTTRWYRERYGDRMDVRTDDEIVGAIRIFNTPYKLDVPITTHTPGTPGETVWLRFPDEVLAEEKPLDWLVHGPNLSNAPRSDVQKARRHATEVAGALRFIRVNIMGARGNDDRFNELIGGVVGHLERAAEQLVKADPDSLKRAHWDMQMACELALKALAQQRSGTFTETHDLFVLYDRTPDDAPKLKRQILSKLPRWEVMVDLRYGGGPTVTLETAFQTYRACLKIVVGAVDGLRRMGLGKASFEIRRPPWLPDEAAQGEASATG